MKLWKTVLDEVNHQIRPTFPPLAIKFVKKDEKIPEKAMKPKRDIGHHLAMCQAFAIAGENRKEIVQTLEDEWCAEAIFCFGLAEPHKDFLSGKMNYSEGYYLKNLEAAKNFANSFPHLKHGIYKGVIIAPAENATFEPDLLLLFCNPRQTQTLQAARRYTDGKPINADLGGGGCVRAVIPTMLDKKCHIALPCNGLFVYGLIQDDKMMFTIPNEKTELEALHEGLKHIWGGRRTPSPRLWVVNVPLPSGYIKIRKKMGLDTPEPAVYKPT